ncbi:DUF4375 domain-containing protein [Pseudenhygromyxa sp. WMMC2535]|uniref:DMP19 family protein n=1 Tax=Pseudenhygromyxa sp. WMMC2535 TaxID=2712867 RepID=UPI001554B33A|nr:DUF4375 domain-containing protein [Pseudenhygromyxa sp. WMMC2535]NVB38831.1 DUF4375 domain-containing protein [Pseudenhygromyxa sp. WMMC2535]
MQLAGAEPPWAPAPILTAITAMLAAEPDLANGGIDQLVWNTGPGMAREFAAAWRAVGAIENAELLVELAHAYEQFTSEQGTEQIAADPVRAFFQFRKRVGGPWLASPDPHAELGEALLEWSLEHPNAFRQPADA